MGVGKTVWAKSPTFEEYQVKAAFLYYFGKFVEWPETAFESANQSFVICVLGEDPFGKELDAVVRDKSINNRPVLVQRMQDVSDMGTCHLLFVSASEQENISEVLRAIKWGGVLTVSEASQFIEKGGNIQFLFQDNKVRFVINVTSAERAGLKMSSQLLKLAATRRD